MTTPNPGLREAVHTVVANLTVEGARAAAVELSGRDASVSKLMMVSAIEGLCDMRSQQFAVKDPAGQEFFDLACALSGVTQATRLALASHPDGTGEAATVGGPQRYSALLANREVMSMLAPYLAPPQRGGLGD